MESNKQSPPLDQHCEDSLCRSRSTRREVLGICSTCALAYAATAPRVLGAWGDPIPVGTLQDYSKDEISEKYIQHNFFVTRHKGRLFATIATCPHKENYLFRNSKDPKRIICSGHDAVFDPAGKPISGPVRQGLIRFGIAVDKKGIVRVDPNKRFPEAKWGQTGSYIPVKTTASTISPDSPQQAGGTELAAPAEGEKKVPEKKAATKEDAVLREWSDSTGAYKVKAYFMGIANGMVKLKRADNGRLIDVPRDRLSDTDKQWLQSRSK